jgi:hypothetical protein
MHYMFSPSRFHAQTIAFLVEYIRVLHVKLVVAQLTSLEPVSIFQSSQESAVTPQPYPLEFKVYTHISHVSDKFCYYYFAYV